MFVKGLIKEQQKCVQALKVPRRPTTRGAFLGRAGQVVEAAVSKRPRWTTEMNLRRKLQPLCSLQTAGN